MKRSKFSEAQIAFVLKQADGGTSISQVYLSWAFFSVVERTPEVRKSQLPVSRLDRTADHFLHDLVGAAIDARDACVAPQAGDRIFVHIAGAAMELER